MTLSTRVTANEPLPDGGVATSRGAVMSRLRTALAILRAEGPMEFARLLNWWILSRAVRFRDVWAEDTLAMYDLVRHASAQARVLEIGGPSQVFAPGGPLPIYLWCASADNCNYLEETLWERGLSEGGSYAPVQSRPRLGRQFIAEASAMSTDHPYDMLVSSHMIEHTANPIGALRRWRSLCVPDGWLLLVLPHREGTFDHRRPLTDIEHMLDDERNATPETDTTHFGEILRLHDHRRDPGLPSSADLAGRLADNARTRAAHHHVFDTRRAAEMVAAAGWEPVYAEAQHPVDIFILARNREPRSPLAGLRVRSPFPGDRD